MAAIGFFDSGVGGTSIWKEVIKLLPNEDTIYLADSKYAPYGEKTKEKIIERCIQNTEILINKGCKLIVVACNTATTNAIDYLRKTYSISFIGIEPAIKPAALYTKTKVIGVLATRGTLQSNLFEKTALEFTQNVKVVMQNADKLVPLIEENNHHSQKMKDLLKVYLTPMLDENIDYLVLGCTHYPYITSEIQKIVGKDVNIIDSGEAVAIQIKKILTSKKLLASPNHQAKHYLYTNKSTQILNAFLEDVSCIYEVNQLRF